MRRAGPGLEHGCTFCSILRGESEAYFVYRSGRGAAFLDKYPVSRGHTLVVPTVHYRDLLDAPDEVLADLMRVVKAVARAQVRALGAGGVRVVQNNGAPAGQVIFHLHFHVIPAYEGASWGRRPLRPGEGEEVSELLARAVAEELGQGSGSPRAEA